MTIQPVGAAAAALFCTPDDLSAYGYTTAALTLDQALRLVRDASRLAGLPLELVAELEIFPAADGALIFAHLKQERPTRPVPCRPPRHSRVRRHPT